MKKTTLSGLWFVLVLVVLSLVSASSYAGGKSKGSKVGSDEPPHAGLVKVPVKFGERLENGVDITGKTPVELTNGLLGKRSLENKDASIVRDANPGAFEFWCEGLKAEIGFDEVPSTETVDAGTRSFKKLVSGKCPRGYYAVAPGYDFVWMPTVGYSGVVTANGDLSNQVGLTEGRLEGANRVAREIGEINQSLRETINVRIKAETDKVLILDDSVSTLWIVLISLGVVALTCFAGFAVWLIGDRRDQRDQYDGLISQLSMIGVLGNPQSVYQAPHGGSASPAPDSNPLGSPSAAPAAPNGAQSAPAVVADEPIAAPVPVEAVRVDDAPTAQPAVEPEAPAADAPTEVSVETSAPTVEDLNLAAPAATSDAPPPPAGEDDTRKTGALPVDRTFDYIRSLFHQDDEGGHVCRLCDNGNRITKPGDRRLLEPFRQHLSADHPSVLDQFENPPPQREEADTHKVSVPTRTSSPEPEGLADVSGTEERPPPENSDEFTIEHDGDTLIIAGSGRLLLGPPGTSEAEKASSEVA